MPSDHVTVLVPVSGGKDSQAALKLAVREHGSERVRGLFCDTQFEHPLTYAHIDLMRAIYDVRIDTVTAGSVLEKTLKYGRFPGGGARHCTEELKIVPTKRYCRDLALAQGSSRELALLARRRGRAALATIAQERARAMAGGFEVWYGMRTGESRERAARYEGKVSDEVYLPHEVLRKYPKYLADLGVRFRLPVVDWTEAEVMAFLDGLHNPLYDQGFERVGCFPCLASGDRWKEKAFQHDDFGRSQYVAVIEVSKRIGKTVFTSKGGQARNSAPCEVCNL